MKKTVDPRWMDFKERLLPLPFLLLMTLAVVLFLGALLFLMYSIVTVTAFKSAMVFFIVFAASGICTGLGLLSLHGFFAYGKYYKKHKGTLVSAPKTATAEKTFKDYITLQNVALIILLVATVFAIVSAALGCINRDKWVQATSPYMEKVGYNADVNYREYRYSVGDAEDANKLVINLKDKNAVVIYTDEASKQGFVTICGYDKYKNEIVIQRNGRTLTLTEGEQPCLDGATEKLLFFLFQENEIEKQIKIYIPASLKYSFVIEGEYVKAK